MMKNKLKALEAKSGTGRLFDGGGLWLIKRSSEAGSWRYRYQFQKKSREMGLGPFPQVSLADARKIRDHWANVLQSGRDPVAVRDEQNQTSAEPKAYDPTFADAVITTFDAKKGGLKGNGEAGRWLSPLELYMLPAIGSKRMTQINQHDIVDALRPIWTTKHPTAVKAIQRTAMVFRHMRLAGVRCDPFNVEAAKHLLGDHVHETVNVPASAWEDIPRIFAAVQGDEPTRMALRFSILTAMRSDAVRYARFSEINLDERVWTVPKERMKGRRGQVKDFRVPLSTCAVSLVERAVELSWNEFLFPGRGRKGGVTDVGVTKQLHKVDPKVSIHGLRTSFRTWIQDKKICDWHTAEVCLAHIVGTEVERSYARSDVLEARRPVMQAWCDYLTSQAV
jgi:integrase